MSEYKKELSLATDRECAERRSLLIRCGAISPASKLDVVRKKDGSFAASTRKQGERTRQKLIDLGIIESKFCDIPVTQRVSGVRENEGEYSPTPINDNIDYQNKKSIYFRMMQEILTSRRTLRLALGKKNESDPDWYF